MSKRVPRKPTPRPFRPTYDVTTSSRVPGRADTEQRPEPKPAERER